MVTLFERLFLWRTISSKKRYETNCSSKFKTVSTILTVHIQTEHLVRNVQAGQLFMTSLHIVYCFVYVWCILYCVRRDIALVSIKTCSLWHGVPRSSRLAGVSRSLYRLLVALLHFAVKLLKTHILLLLLLFKLLLSSLFIIAWLLPRSISWHCMDIWTLLQPLLGPAAFKHIWMFEKCVPLHRSGGNCLAFLTRFPASPGILLLTTEQTSRCLS